MNKTIKFLIGKNENGKRVDLYLSNKFSQFTRSYIKKLIKEKNLSINNRIIESASTRIKIGDKINFDFSYKRLGGSSRSRKF